MAKKKSKKKDDNKKKAKKKKLLNLKLKKVKLLKKKKEAAREKDEKALAKKKEAKKKEARKKEAKKKNGKKGNKKEKKKPLTIAKPKANVPIETVKSPAPKATAPLKQKIDHSSNYNVKDAERKLRALKSKEEVLAFMKGEERVSLTRILPAVMNKLEP